MINPWDIDAVADAIHQAVTMPDDEREIRHNRLFKYIAKYTASYWGEVFIKELDRVNRAAERFNNTPKLTWEVVRRQYQSSSRRVLVLVAETTLIPYGLVPYYSTPTQRYYSVLTY